MFTGIITDQGRIAAIEDRDGGKCFTISTSYDVANIAIGASIAHNGVCLTVTAIDASNSTYQVEAWEEALRLTTLADFKINQIINLERALKIGDELGGHIVSGHVDGIAKVTSITDEGEAKRFTLKAPDELARFIAPKGSVALDGTSLTVNKVEANSFDVLIISHTLQVTTWGKLAVGDAVNLEVDTMARYAARLSQFQ